MKENVKESEEMNENFNESVTYSFCESDQSHVRCLREKRQCDEDGIAHMLKVLRRQRHIDHKDEGRRRRIGFGEAVFHSGEVRDELRGCGLEVVVSLRERVTLEAERAHPELGRNVDRTARKMSDQTIEKKLKKFKHKWK